MLLAAAALLLGGCVTREPRTTSRVALPPAYAEVPANAVAPADAAIARDWWHSFNSATLDGLIDEALAGSSDLRIAQERVTQAEIALRVANGSLFPTAGLSASTSSSRSGAADDGFADSQRRSTSVGLSVGYEVDLWGRLAADRRGARAALEVSRYDYEAARLSLQTTVAFTYFQLLSARARLEIAAREPGDRRARAAHHRRAVSQRPSPPRSTFRSRPPRCCSSARR